MIGSVTLQCSPDEHRESNFLFIQWECIEGCVPLHLIRESTFSLPLPTALPDRRFQLHAWKLSSNMACFYLVFLSGSHAIRFSHAVNYNVLPSEAEDS
jgi:hypothetical protein